MHSQTTNTNPFSGRESRIYLTGFMGSGKTTIGPILANTIGYDFIDVDRAIVLQTGKSVEQIFRDEGEARFRDLEKEMVASMKSKHRLVISLGGGTISDLEALNDIKRSGILIYLKAAPEQIFERLHHKTDRPTLKDAQGDRLADEQLRSRIQELYRMREPLYLQADIVVRTDERRVGLTVDHIVKKLSPILKTLP